MATLKDILDAARDPENRGLIPGTLLLSATIADALEKAEQGEYVDPGFHEFLLRSRTFAEMCVELGWPPPWHMPVRLIDTIATARREKRISPTDVEQRFLEFYSPDKVDSLASGWDQVPWLAERHAVLREGVDNYGAGRHYSAVCLLLPQIEGIFGDSLGRKPNAQNDASMFFRDTRLGAVARDFYIRVYRESFSWDATSPIPELSRNAILHGRVANYGTAKHSLKVILVLDAVIGALLAEREADA